MNIVWQQFFKNEQAYINFNTFKLYTLHDPKQKKNQTRICASLGLRMKFKTLWLSDHAVFQTNLKFHICQVQGAVNPSNAIKNVWN